MKKDEIFRIALVQWAANIAKQTKNSGSYYFSYKGRFSIVLLALVDANYKFMYVDVDSNGRISHGGVFRNTVLSKAISTNLLNIPGPYTLEDGETEAPYVIIADDVFPLMENFMKPYSFRGLSKEQRIYNYHLSKARRIVKNVLGILANRFKIFLSPILLSPEMCRNPYTCMLLLTQFLSR